MERGREIKIRERQGLWKGERKTQFEGGLEGDHLNVKGEKEEIDEKGHGNLSLDNCIYSLLLTKIRNISAR